MSLQALDFDLSEIEPYRGTPYWAAALGCAWCGTLLWPLFLLVPALVFLGFSAAIWSSLRRSNFEKTGRRASRERLLEMLKMQRDQDCERTRNLRIYLAIAPYFWTVYAIFVIAVLVLRLSAN